MINMFELFQQAQGGAAFDNVARAYGLSPEQMRAATAALTPAFAQGFQRQGESDEKARRFAQLFQTEAYARAFDAHAASLDAATKGAGDDALGALFGSKDVSRAVASQAAAASGVQADIIRKVLPVLASIIVGGFMKAAQGAPASSPAGQAFPGLLGDLWGQIAGGGAASPGRAAPNPQNPFQEWMDGFGKPSGKAGEASSNPLGDMMAATLNGMFGGTPSADAPEPPPVPREEPAPSAKASPFDDVAATGREFSDQNAKAMEQIFDAFFGKKTG